MHPSAFIKSMPSGGTSANEEERVLPNWTNPALYKTRFCDNFRNTGECKFGFGCWFAHTDKELRSVPRLDRHPEAALNAVNQVIRSLPPSRSRKVAMSKSQQLYKELAGKNTIDNTDLPDDLHREILPLKEVRSCAVPRDFVYYQMPTAIFTNLAYTVVTGSSRIHYEDA